MKISYLQDSRCQRFCEPPVSSNKSYKQLIFVKLPQVDPPAIRRVVQYGTIFSGGVDRRQQSHGILRVQFLCLRDLDIGILVTEEFVSRFTPCEKKFERKSEKILVTGYTHFGFKLLA